MADLYRAKCDFQLMRRVTDNSPLVTIFKAVQGQLVTVIKHSAKWSYLVDGAKTLLVPNFEFGPYLEPFEEKPTCVSTS